MRFFADFHIHSKYSRATSSDMNIPSISKAAKSKGIKLMGTGDFTHPGWLKELKEHLAPVDDNPSLGILAPKKGKVGVGGQKWVGNAKKCDQREQGFAEGVPADTYFILTTEVNNIYEKHGKLRKIHNIIFAPTFEAVDLINGYLTRYGNLEADGRPTLTVDSESIIHEILDLVPDAFIVPAHIWTPWFSLFGANFGFDRIEECFDKETLQIGALETGLSSDPPMNWMWSELDRFALISNSDAHSPRNIGREANCFDCELIYSEITHVIKSQDPKKFKFTTEFFPQEGKYHWDGHRKCGIRISPEEAIAHDNICPNCGKHITVGVMHRVITLSDRKEPKEGDIPCRHLIPLLEIISDTLGVGKETEKALNEYNKLVYHFGSEFECLLYAPYEELQTVTSPQIAHSICAVREGKVDILPGYDGVYGKISIQKEEKKEAQLKLF